MKLIHSTPDRLFLQHLKILLDAEGVACETRRDALGMTFGDVPAQETWAEIWAEDLADLIAHLGRGPAWIAGGSGGCRTSVIAVLRRPEVARGLICWSASGGEFASQFLGFQVSEGCRPQVRPLLPFGIAFPVASSMA